eukprot:731444-Pelagomonas_calceolata.AAC.5
MLLGWQPGTQARHNCTSSTDSALLQAALTCAQCGWAHPASPARLRTRLLLQMPPHRPPGAAEQCVQPR